MPDWDEDRPQLRKNLTGVLKEIIQAAEQRETPTLEMARRWHTLEKVRVRVSGNYGVEPADVAEELRRFETTVLTLVAQLDESLPIDREPNADQLAAIIDLCAWAHAEWIRIQPFANGNGRTARLWANSLAMRHGLPPFVRLRPRPDPGYGSAGVTAMQGDWKPTVTVFRRLLDRLLDEL